MKKNKIISGLALATLPAVAVASASHVAFAEDSKLPSIIGRARTVDLGSTFNPMDGIQALDHDGTDLTDRVQVSGTVDTSVIGKQTLTYSVTNDAGHTFELRLTFNVRDTSMPEMTQIKDLIFKQSEGKPSDFSSYFTISDAHDPNVAQSLALEGDFPTTAGEHDVIFTIVDASNNRLRMETTITILDDIAPELEVQDITVEKPAVADLKTAIVKASDNTDGDISQSVTFEAPAEMTVGTHTVKALLADKAGNKVEKEFTVTIVAENQKPTISGTQNVSIIQGQDFNPRTLVSATDPEGQPVTIKWLNETEDLTVVGEHVLRFQAVDEKGKESDIFEMTVLVKSKTIKITFEENGGDEMLDMTIERGQLLFPDKATRGDDKFVDWYLDAEFTKPYRHDVFLEEDTTLYARFAKPVDLEFLVDGALHEKIEAWDHEPEYKSPKIPKAPDGLMFAGWFTESGEPYSEIQIYTKNTTFHARFLVPVINKHNVTFVKHNGEDNVVVEREHGKAIEVQPEVPVRDGYKFLGWFIGDTPYDPQTIVEQDVTVEAKWEKIPVVKRVTITFNPDNGESVGSFVRNEGESVGEIADPVREGYVFLGWFEQSSGARYSANATFSEDANFIAKWEKKEDPKPEVKVFFESYNIKNIVGYSVVPISEDGLFTGSVDDGSGLKVFTMDNFKELGLELSIPSGVSVEGGRVVFTAPGTYVFTLSGYGRSVTSTVTIADVPKLEPKIIVTTGQGAHAILAGQSFNPMSLIDVANGSKDNVIVTFWDENGSIVNVDTNNMPFGKYTVVYGLPNGSSATLELIVSTPPQQTEGNKPTLLVRDRLIVEQGKQLNFLELAQAADINGSSLTESIKVSGEVDWNTVGKYTVVFSVTDSEGRTTEKSVVVEVLAKEQYDAEISREKAEGVSVQTADMSVTTSSVIPSLMIFGSAATGLMTLVIKRKRDEE